MRHLLPLLALALAGCSTTGLANILEALGKDQATMCAKVVYGPALIQVYRTNAPNAIVKCGNDELDVVSPSK